MVLHQPMKALAENEVKNLLKKYDIPTTNYIVIQDMGDLETIHLSFPVALKVCSPDILHKTELGGVQLDIPDKQALLTAFKKFKKKFPKQKFLLEEMEKKGIEIIAGVIKDSTFGLSIMVGIGGIFTELYHDVSFRVIPITPKDAEDMLEELKGKQIFEGFRNMKADKKALINLLMKLSHLAQNESISQMDLNPIFVYKKGLTVVDAKLIRK